MINWIILLYGIICGVAGVVFGIWIYKKIHAAEVAHMNNKVRFYESRNHYIYQDTAEAICDADERELWG